MKPSLAVDESTNRRASKTAFVTASFLRHGCLGVADSEGAYQTEFELLKRAKPGEPWRPMSTLELFLPKLKFHGVEGLCEATPRHEEALVGLQRHERREGQGNGDVS